jgi:hypothetical protein
MGNEKQHQKEDGPSSEQISTTSSLDKSQRHDLESGLRVHNVPDTHEQITHEGTAAHPLFRIFNRNRSSPINGKEHIRVARQGIGKTVDPHKVLPTSKFQRTSIY